MRSDRGGPPESIDDLVARYLDLLNSGESMDANSILEEHPDVGREVVRLLETFVDLGQGSRPVDLGVLGDYQLRREIGRGGMGVVYEAWQGSMSRTVALKILPAGIAVDQRAVARFIREAQASGRLQHPNVVPVFGMGIEAGTPYYAMELVEGETLAPILARRGSARQVSSDTAPDAAAWILADEIDIIYCGRAAEAFAGAAEGLHHAHQKGIIHRDLKPSNLILDPSGRLRILDFGLARLEGHESLTASGGIVGTPCYMSPEQAAARKVPIDHRTDVYSLGASLYELLAGRPPFRGKDNQETLSQIIARDPQPIRSTSPRVSKDLDTIVLKCLRKDPEGRYATAEALAQDLRRFVRGDPIEARPQSGWERLASRIRRHRKTLAVGIAFLILLAAAAWLAYGRQRAESEMARARYRPAVLRVLRKIQAGRFSLQAVAGESPGLLDFSGSRIRAITREDIASLLGAGGPTSLEEALRELEAVSRSLPGRGDAHYHLARGYLLLGRVEAAKREIEAAIEADPEFVPARVLRAEMEAGEGGADVMTMIREECAAAEWQRSWLRARESARDRRWPEAIRAYGDLIASGWEETEPYIGCRGEAYLGRGIAWLETGEYLRAQEDFAVARASAAGIEPALLLAKAHYLRDLPDGRDRAEAIFRELYDDAEGRDRLETALWIIAVYDSLWANERALEWTEKLEGTAIVDRLQSLFFFRNGDTSKAIAAAQRAIEADPRDLSAHLVQGWALFTELSSGSAPDPEGLCRGLLLVARQAVKLAPDDSRARTLLAAAEGEGKASSRILQRRRTMKPRHTSPLLVPALVAGLGGVAGAQPAGFFTDVRLVEGINTPYCEWVPSISSDGLTIYFDSDRPGGYGDRDLYMATRPTLGEPFKDVTNLKELNSPWWDTGLVVARSGLMAVFSSGRPPGNSQSGDLWLATRASPDDAWEIRNLEDINTPDNEFHPRLSCDGRTLLFTRTGQPGNSSTNDLWLATWDGRTWANARNLTEVNSPTNDRNACLSCDGHTLAWDSVRGGGLGGWDIWWAARDNDSGAFCGVLNVGDPVNTPFQDCCPYLSSDWPRSGSTLYFTRYVGDGLPDIYQATWIADCNDNGIDDAEDIETGDSQDANGNGFPDECEARFVRGETNADGRIDLADMVATLMYLFADGRAASCLKAADVNDDGSVNLGDPVFGLNYLFADGPKPPPPLDECGIDPTADWLSCVSSPACE